MIFFLGGWGGEVFALFVARDSRAFFGSNTRTTTKTQ